MFTLKKLDFFWANQETNFKNPTVNISIFLKILLVVQQQMQILKKKDGFFLACVNRRLTSDSEGSESARCETAVFANQLVLLLIELIDNARSLLFELKFIQHLRAKKVKIKTLATSLCIQFLLDYQMKNTLRERFSSQIHYLRIRSSYFQNHGLRTIKIAFHLPLSLKQKRRPKNCLRFFKRRLVYFRNLITKYRYKLLSDIIAKNVNILQSINKTITS